MRLGPWKGSYEGVDAVWLRWYTPGGELLLTEDAERANKAARRVDTLTRKLRELGFDPDQIR